jgi:23S rRNA pseudouridine1911/1915/1917 synthase
MKKIKILYEDKDILAIDKPAGILTCPDERSDEETIFDIFKKKYPKLEVVHRLDKDTSGVLLLAKNKKAHEFLKRQFQNHEIKKVYHAVVAGKFKNVEGTINKPIGRSPADFRKRLAGRGARGLLREAVTKYKVLKEFTSPQPSPHKREGDKFSYLEVYPRTGRTHQIRVHMKFFNHPIVGDTLYNPSKSSLPNLPLSKREEKGGGRMMLHAKSIEFKNLKSETVKVESPIPVLFKKIVK